MTKLVCFKVGNSVNSSHVLHHGAVICSFWIGELAALEGSRFKFYLPHRSVNWY